MYSNFHSKSYVTLKPTFPNFGLFFLHHQTMHFPNGVIGARARRHVAVDHSQDLEHAKSLKLVWVHRRISENATLKTAVRFLYNLLNTR